MILFQGYMGTILHTGDMRFSDSFFDECTYLYPKELRTSDLKKCSIHIDELTFDNTYCDPIFVFPTRVFFEEIKNIKFDIKEKVFEDMKEIIEKHRDSRVLIGVDSIGKEEVMVRLAEYFQTLV